MSYTAPPSASLGRAPLPSDDASKGFVVGATIVDATVEPPILYVCANNAVGSALWVAAGGVVLQSAGASVGHAYVLNFADGTVTTTQGIATFTPPSGWSSFTAFVATAGQTFFPVLNVNPDPGRHAVTRNGLLMLGGDGNDYTVTTAGILFSYPLEAGTVVQVLA